ncbi:MAG TPA: DUF2079 domain-containing protein [Candidatus Eisenbacteria bacterium]
MSSRDPARGCARDTALLAAVGVVLFVALKLNQWQSLGVHSELAEFESRIASTLHGAFMQRHPGEPPFFAEHFSPVLLALVPVYALVPSPVLLLVLHALAAALAVVPLHRLALDLLRERAAALAIGLAWLVSRTLNYGLMYDVHMEILYPACFFAAFLAFERGRWIALAAALLVAASCKEDAGLSIAGFGVYAVLRGARGRGALLAAAGLAWTALAVAVVIPAFRPRGAPAAYTFLGYWSGYGRTQGEILRGMLNPATQARVLFAPGKLGQMFDLFAAFLFLPFAEPAAAACLVLPGWFILYSSNNPIMNGPILYYGLLLLPFLFYATLLGIARIARRAAPAARARWVTGLACAVLAVQLGNTRLVQQLSPGAFRGHARAAVARDLIGLIPRGAPVSAQINLVSYLPVESDRRYLPEGLDRAAYALFDTLGYQWPLGPERNRALLAGLEAPAWEQIAARDGFVLLRRREPPPGLPTPR